MERLSREKCTKVLRYGVGTSTGTSLPSILDRVLWRHVCGIPGCKGHEVKKDADGEFIEFSVAQLEFLKRAAESEAR